MSDKRVVWFTDDVEALPTDIAYYGLSERDVRMLQAACIPMSWSTRWIGGNPTQDYIDQVSGEINERLMNPVDICALVAECIENDPTVQAAIQQMFEDNLTPNNNGSNPVGAGDGNILDGVSCDLDTIYGAAVAIEEYVDAVARDILQVVADADGVAEVAVRILDYMPILGDLPIIDDLNDMYEHISEEGIQSYEAGYTTTNRQDMICEIWQVGCNTCEIKPSDVAIVYATLGGMSVNVGDLLSVLVGIVAGTLTNEAFMYAMHLLVVGVLSAGGSVGGLVGLKTLNLIAKTGTPSDDYLLFCDPCQSEQWYIWDFTASDGGWFLRDDFSPLRGVYLAGEGWKTTDFGSEQGLSIVKDFTGITVEEMQVEGTNYSTPTFNMDNRNMRLRDDYTSSSGQVAVQSGTGGAAENLCDTGVTGLPASRAYGLINYDTGNDTQEWICTRIAIRYSAGTPTGGSASGSGIC